MAWAARSLPYLENENSNVLIDGFSNFYIARISLFKNSAHILDVEDLIRARLSAMTFMDEGQPLHIHRFVIPRRSQVFRLRTPSQVCWEKLSR